MSGIDFCPNLLLTLQRRPDALAFISGSGDYPAIRGTAVFYQTDCGVLVAAELRGLPNPKERCAAPVFGFHIHEGGRCAGTEENPFADAKGHFNPGGCEHPHHAGDMPPLFGNRGYALSVFLTDRFTVREVIGRTVIVHARPDDFTTQPSGNAGAMIACGEIRAMRQTNPAEVL